MNPELRTHLFDSTVLPAFCYAAEMCPDIVVTSRAFGTTHRTLERHLLKYNRRTQHLVGLRSSHISMSRLRGPAEYVSKAKHRWAGHIMRRQMDTKNSGMNLTQSKTFSRKAINQMRVKINGSGPSERRRRGSSPTSWMTSERKKRWKQCCCLREGWREAIFKCPTAIFQFDFVQSNHVEADDGSFEEDVEVALITNHASSYMIMCEAFRTPEHVDDKKLENAVITRSATNEQLQGTLRSKSLDLFRIKTEPTADSPDPPPSIRLPTEYGSLPPDYGTLIPQDYGRPVPGIEGRSEMHTFFDSKLFEDNTACQKTNRAAVITEGVNVGWLPTGLQERRRDAAATGKALSFSLSGLTPVMAAMIDYVMKPFRQLNISTTEFAALQAIMFFDP
ncbi:unnamed protein product, partial [Strongylus vulgaris]